MEGSMFQLGCSKIWSRHAKTAAENREMSAVLQAGLKGHTLTTLSGMS